MYRFMVLVLCFAITLALASSSSPDEPVLKEEVKSKVKVKTAISFPLVSFPLVSYSRYALLTKHPEVLDELEMSTPQREEIKKRYEEISHQASEIAQSLRPRVAQKVDPALWSEMMKPAHLASVNFVLSSEGLFLKILDRDQRRRLEEIHLQVEGPMAFLRPEFQLRLNMSPEQVELVTNMVQDATELAFQKTVAANEIASAARAKDRRDNPQLNPEPKNKKDWTEPVYSQTGKDAIKSIVKAKVKDNLELRGYLDREIAKVLTKVQRENYKKLLGRPFIKDGRVIPRQIAVE